MKHLAISTKGLTGENLAFMQLLNEKFAELPEPIDKDGVVLEIKSLLKGMIFNDKGEQALDFTKLNEMLGDDDKGIRQILKKQGEELQSLKELRGQLTKPRTFKDELTDSMKDLEKIVSEKKGHLKLNIKAAATHTLANTITGDNSLPDELIESFSISTFVPKRYPREYVFDIANHRTVPSITQFKTWLEEGSEQGAFAIVAEGAVKPLISYQLVRNFSEYEKVAGKYVVTEEFAKFRSEAYSIIQRLINQKILRDYSALLTTRLLADAVPYVASALDGQYADATDFHAIAAVAAQIEALNFMPDVLIMNPQDKWRIGMTQNNQGSFYLTIPMTSPTGQTTMMGFTVRTSNRIPVGNFILGESNLWEVEDETLTVRLGYGIDVTTSGGNVTAVTSDFDNNRFRVIVETFFHSYIATNNTGSFVYGNFAAIKALVSQ